MYRWGWNGGDGGKESLCVGFYIVLSLHCGGHGRERVCVYTIEGQGELVVRFWVYEEGFRLWIPT